MFKVCIYTGLIRGLFIKSLFLEAAAKHLHLGLAENSATM